jgi:hypothetical protein
MVMAWVQAALYPYVMLLFHLAWFLIILILMMIVTQTIMTVLEIVMVQVG